MKLLRGKSSERGNVMSESESERCESEDSVWVRVEDALFFG